MWHNHFWEGKNVLITGHTGFKGAWLAYWLSKLGANVTGIALPPSQSPNLFEALQLQDCIHSYFVDINNKDKLAQQMKTTSPEILFHLAAQATVPASYEDPLTTLSTNIMGTAHILSAIQTLNTLRACIIVTSDKCYENNDSRNVLNENARLGGIDPYSISKACAELVTAAYRNTYHTPERALITVRAGNVIGGGDFTASRLIPDCIGALMNKETITLRVPNATRPWQYVLEPLCGYMLVAQKAWTEPSKYSGAWNFGPKHSLTVEKVVAQVIQEWGEGEWQTQQNFQWQESSSIQLDSHKAGQALGWHCCYDTKTAIAATTQWYKKYFNNQSTDYTREQCRNAIQHYYMSAVQQAIPWVGL